jgi:hypothetical protein
MCEDQTGATGTRARFMPIETRRIVLAQGNEFHESDAEDREAWRTRMIGVLESDPSGWHGDQYCERFNRSSRWEERGMSDQQIADIILGYLRRQRFQTDMGFLEESIGAPFELASDGMTASYLNSDQRVRYEIEIIHSKREFKSALTTEGIIVVYGGHSRYGRGTSFDTYSGRYNHHGEQWEDGTSADNGNFRLGYPYVGIPLEDIEHHQYHCAPLAVEIPRPTTTRRHPRRTHPEVPGRLSRVTMPENLRRFVQVEFASPSHQYWGYTRSSKVHVLLTAGWTGSCAAPYDIGATDLQCRTFCHFGCSSKKHFWNIVRRPDYKDYRRNRPPTDKFAYFTREPANWKTIYWMYFLMAYDRPNSATHWWDSHEYAKRMTNRRLRREDMDFRIY